MSLKGQGFQVADAKVTGPGVERVAESEGTESGIAAGAPATDGQPVAIHLPLLDQIAGCVDTVININHAPLFRQPLAIGAAITRAAAVIHIHHGEPPASPILSFQTQAAGGSACRSPVAKHQQGGAFISRGSVVPVFGRIEKGVGRQTIFGREFDGLGDRQITLVNR